MVNMEVTGDEGSNTFVDLQSNSVACNSISAHNCPVSGQDMPSSLYHPARFLTTLLRGGDINRRGAELLGEMLQEQN
ncbi:hypothetical protein MTR67_015826 [Solanum verrucosum]|uniref:Uncharacterized protein n=1 Tax=Solanum verrucosum TaxID=315347 RepID=A0AAF0QFQ9_SOLVR|nr:hypothetical protein MTR67_015826 [Solanum verrucosum]